MAKIKVFYVEDHALVRDGLRAVTSSQPDLEVVGEAGDGEGLVEKVGASGADVVVMDVNMPRVGGVAATRELRAKLPQVKVLALSAHEDGGYVEQMRGVGAVGYAIKRSTCEELMRAIRCVAAGGTYFDPAMGVAALSAGQAPTTVKLSEREEEVLRLIARGYSFKEIAAALDIGVRTIETYRARAMEKAALKSRADVVRYAAERGWFAEDDASPSEER